MQEAIFLPNPVSTSNHSFRSDLDRDHGRLNDLLAQGCKVVHAVPAGHYTFLIIEHPDR